MRLLVLVLVIVSVICLMLTTMTAYDFFAGIGTLSELVKPGIVALVCAGAAWLISFPNSRT